MNEESRELRVVNRNFSLGEYGESWTKIERYLFIEIYNVIKEFYIAKNAENITAFSTDSITVKLPICMIDKRLFKSKNKNTQLFDAAEGLSQKQISIKTMTKEGEVGFDFTNMFTRITYNPERDKENMYVKIPSEIYEDMVPIESFCQLDLRLISEFNSGNTIRLYEVFKSYSFKKSFNVTFTDLRKKLGFYKEEKYLEWKHFNNKVLKPAVKNINDHKEYDIEVFYSKGKGSDTIRFRVITHADQDAIAIKVLYLDEVICAETREPNMIQNKYIDTTLKNCLKYISISDPAELKNWIISDLMMQQQKQGDDFNFRHSMNAISKQLREGVYTQPYGHR